MDSQLVDATWGLVVATALLFLATSVPAVVQLNERRNQRRALASQLIPSLHGMRSHAAEARSALLKMDSSTSPEEIARVYFEIEPACDQIESLQSHRGLSIDQRLELYVLGGHLQLLGLHLSLLGSEDEELRASVLADQSQEEILRKAAIRAQAALVSLDRVDRLFIEVKKKYGGRTFTEEMIRRTESDSDIAEKDLVDVRRRLRRPTE